ncbi:MAG: NAD-dependent epimerase/dehydratase family protein [Myxococcales bacterium]|nr:NAD-dependent epimerase/dehydratase family protein [Myxococcales bacterium]MCB9708338.1 NAD-dependent epimerase/dehydratase family protein [Myxococcales bacterium]
MARVLVTGGAGFIGAHTVRALLKRGQAVTVLDDLSTGAESNLTALAGDLEFVKGTVCSDDDIQRSLRSVDRIIHLAAVVSVVRSVNDPVGCDAVNVHGTVRLLDRARHAQIRRIVFASSAAVYGEDPSQPKVESARIEVLSGYAASKACGELYMQMFHRLYHMEPVVLRYFNVFGPRQNPKSQYAAVIPTFIDCMLKGTPPTVNGDGEQTRDFCCVDNVVDANLRALESRDAVGRVINIGTGTRTSLNQLLDMLGVIGNTRLAPIFGPAVLGDLRHSVADISLARTLMDYAPRVSLTEGLAQTVAYLRQVQSLA